jgi:hypothetical protein
VDLGAAAAAVQKAEADWPEKKNDLESRLATALAIQTRSDELWQSTTEARRAAAANDYAKVDFGTLFAAFVSLPRFGTSRTLSIAVTVNASIGLIAWLVFRACRSAGAGRFDPSRDPLKQVAAEIAGLPATDLPQGLVFLADALVRRGVPFRTAHHVVGSLVAQAEGEGLGLDEVPDAMIGLALGAAGDETARALAAEEGIGDLIRGAASVEGALEACDVVGGTAPGRVAAALAAAKARLGEG